MLFCPMETFSRHKVKSQKATEGWELLTAQFPGLQRCLRESRALRDEQSSKANIM